MKKILALSLVLLLAFSLCACSSRDYSSAEKLFRDGQYGRAAEAFEALGDYQDSAAMAKACRYEEARELMSGGDYARAITLFQALGRYQDCDDQIRECNYQLACSDLAKVRLDEAAERFTALGSYRDSADKLLLCTQSNLSGAWKLSGLEMGGEDYSSLVSMFDLSLEFKADGTGTMFYDGDTIPLTWDGSSFSDGRDTFNYTMVDGTLQFEAEDMVFIFSRG